MKRFGQLCTRRKFNTAKDRAATKQMSHRGSPPKTLPAIRIKRSSMEIVQTSIILAAAVAAAASITASTVAAAEAA